MLTPHTRLFCKSGLFRGPIYNIIYKKIFCIYKIFVTDTTVWRHSPANLGTQGTIILVNNDLINSLFRHVNLVNPNTPDLISTLTLCLLVLNAKEFRAFANNLINLHEWSVNLQKIVNPLFIYGCTKYLQMHKKSKNLQNMGKLR